MMLGFIDSFEKDSKNKFEPFLEQLKKIEGQSKFALVQKQIDTALNTPLTSSMGRVFDAVAALLGVCTHQQHEGQAPAELESLARPHCSSKVQSYDFALNEKDSVTQISTQALFANIVTDMSSGVSNGLISFKFHQTVKKIISQMCHKIRISTGCSVVCLSGGVFQNRLLLELIEKELTMSNFKVYFPNSIPCNDAGLSLGQVAVAAHTR
jgi:hydrogenase maturation protein HypF